MTEHERRMARARTTRSVQWSVRRATTSWRPGSAASRAQRRRGGRIGCWSCGRNVADCASKGCPTARSPLSRAPQLDL